MTNGRGERNAPPSLDSETIPTEAIAHMVYSLTRWGEVETARMASDTGYRYGSCARVFDKASRVIPIAQDGRGRWIVTDETAELARSVLPMVDELKRNLPADGQLYALPIKAHDLRKLLEALEKMLRNR